MNNKEAESMIKTNMKNKAINALNRIDELASLQVVDNEEGEAEQLEKDYNLVFDFINANNEDYEMLAEENKNMAKALSKLGYTRDQISDICNGAI